jgi:hypothetical protein
MWATSDTFAVTTPGRKRAIKVYDKESLAQGFLMGDGAKYDKAFIEKRPGEYKRCDSYCAVKDVCPQKKAREVKVETNK